MKWIMLVFLFLISSTSFGYCTATVFADEWNGEIRSINEGRDFCNQRAGWWGIDQKYFDQYCFMRKESRWDSYGREYFVWPTSFHYKVKEFRYERDYLFQGFGDWFGARVHRGWNAQVRVSYSPNC